MEGMEIPALSGLIAKCWVDAENSLQQRIREKFPDRDEESITELFEGELRSECIKASVTGAVERAFLSDLRRALPGVGDQHRSKIAHGLIATVTFHAREVERQTGGDFGIVLIRPDVRRTMYFGSELTINHDYRRGLLCQAKVLRRSSTWGGLTSNQRKTLPDKLSYSALVLYRYIDQKGARQQLAPFQWQVTRGASVGLIEQWFRLDQFPSLQLSGHVINELAQDQIGTDDKAIIEQFIRPPSRPSLEIKIQWREGDDPGDKVRIYENAAVQQQHVRILGG